MPDELTTAESGDEPMTIAEICAAHGVSRQTLHKLRADPASGFPEPVLVAGSTRAKYPRAAVAAYFAAHPLRPGRRTDLQPGDE
ncbi:hypothetical protein ACFQ9H_19410 [Streptomyces sp. NPDC056517]|uniref:hypothetical protein n=1 Tax=Streptomyces sp. NPDC056517 TaxID=3345848 RepID=UPI003689C40E